MYHATPTIYIDKILKQGLVPKSKNSFSNYPDRVYFILGDDLTQENLMLFGYLQKNRSGETIHDDNQYTILQIEIEKLLSNTQMYIDPRAKNAVYTHDNIPPNAINILGTLAMTGN